MVAKGYLNKLLANAAVVDYIGRHEPEILEHLQLVVNTVSMEEALQQTEQSQTDQKDADGPKEREDEAEAS